MPEVFVSLASLLSGPLGDRARASAPAEPAATKVEPASQATDVDSAGTAIVRELTLMRLAAIEAYERAAHRLLRGLAHDVLGRELLLAPVEIEALVCSALASLADAGPIAIALASADAGRVRSPLPIRIDPHLAAGDLVIDVRDGACESRFAFRLATALEHAENAA